MNIAFRDRTNADVCTDQPAAQFYAGPPPVRRVGMKKNLLFHRHELAGGSVQFVFDHDFCGL